MAKEWTIWKGQQWAVMNFGLLNLEDEDYDIQADALGLLCNDGVTPLWISQMAGKGTTDLDDFLDAYTRATRIHKGKFKALPVDWQKHARIRIEKAKAARARHAMIKEKLRSDAERAGKVYPDDSLMAYYAAGDELFGKGWELADLGA